MLRVITIFKKYEKYKTEIVCIILCYNYCSIVIYQALKLKKINSNLINYNNEIIVNRFKNHK